MAIGNVTPDSFYASSRLADIAAVVTWARTALADGADILDIGGCSTRPNSVFAEEQTEWKRLEPALKAIREALPDTPLSLDTFRPEIARRALTQFGPMIINDISGGSEEMIGVVREFNVPYIWTLRGDLDLPKRHPEWNDIDLILDPGFGFIGSPEADYACMRQMEVLKAFQRPILVGVSRKSMIWKTLGITPEESLSATQVLHLYAIQHGATILRVHDVREAAQTIEIYNKLCNC